jgi:hypothetical protein
MGAVLQKPIAEPRGIGWRGICTKATGYARIGFDTTFDFGPFMRYLWNEV